MFTDRRRRNRSSAAERRENQVKKYNKGKLILSIIAISFIQGLQYCVSPVLGEIQEHFSGVDVSLVQMLITAPGIFSMVVALTSGFLVTKISKKKLLLFAAASAGIVGFLPLAADSFMLLFVSRILYGMGLGIATTMNAAVVAEFFEGEERVQAMGIQAASVGAGIMTTTTVAGMLGKSGFTHAYYINIIGFISLIVLLLCLPDTGTVSLKKGEKIRLNKEVWIIDLFTMLENFFLITFTTNIAMHMAGALKGDTSKAGILTGIFSGSQILIGILLGMVTKVAKKYTLSVAMFSFALGAVILVLFPGNMAMLSIAAVFCGFSQGIFIPTASTNIANVVAPSAVALASATLTCSMNLGQIISPFVLNGVVKAATGSVTTTGVYLASAIGIAVSAVLCIVWKSRETA